MAGIRSLALSQVYSQEGKGDDVPFEAAAAWGAKTIRPLLEIPFEERVLVNGAVIENGDRRARLSIMTPNANILRLRDAIHPEEATTPVKRVCYIAQLLVAGESTDDSALDQLSKGISQLRDAFSGLDGLQGIDEAESALESGNYYATLRALRKLLPIEEELLRRVDNVFSRVERCAQ